MPHAEPSVVTYPYYRSHDERSGAGNLPAKGETKVTAIVAPDTSSIEDGILFGLREVETRGTSIILNLKGVVLNIATDDQFKDIYARYKELEFNALAATYERDFIGRNSAMYCTAAEALRREGARFPEPLRMLDIGCGTGFALREAFAARDTGQYFGIDPAENMLRVLERTAKNCPSVDVTVRQAKAGILRIDSVQDEIVSALGGRPQLITWLASMHVVNKHEPLGPLILATADLLDENGRVVLGNYFHHTEEDFEAFREAYMRTMTHQPTPPAQLFSPSQMEAILRAFWLEVESYEEMVCSDGLRAYVMVAKHK